MVDDAKRPYAEQELALSGIRQIFEQEWEDEIFDGVKNKFSSVRLFPQKLK